MAVVLVVLALAGCSGSTPTPEDLEQAFLLTITEPNVSFEMHTIVEPAEPEAYRQYVASGTHGAKADVGSFRETVVTEPLAFTQALPREPDYELRRTGEGSSWRYLDGEWTGVSVSEATTPNAWSFDKGTGESVDFQSKLIQLRAADLLVTGGETDNGATRVTATANFSRIVGPWFVSLNSTRYPWDWLTDSDADLIPITIDIADGRVRHILFDFTDWYMARTDGDPEALRPATVTTEIFISVLDGPPVVEQPCESPRVVDDDFFGEELRCP